MRRTKLILICLIFGFLKSYGQDFSKNSLFGGIGIGGSHNSRAGGLGINWSMGYQRDLWNNRLRLVPSISFGTYAPLNVPKAYYSSTTLKVNVNFDMLKMKTFSLFMGTGLTANYSSGLIGTGASGLIGTGGWPSGRSSSEYFDESNFTFNGLIGLRLNPKQKRIAYELLLVDGSFGNKNYFSELTVLRVRIIMKLK